MCGRCENEPYRGVTSLFDGDRSAEIEHVDRADWHIISPDVIVYLGMSALPDAAHPLVRVCEVAFDQVDPDVRARVEALGIKVERPAFGTP